MRLGGVESRYGGPSLRQVAPNPLKCQNTVVFQGVKSYAWYRTQYKSGHKER
jgi:hypothetical protein